MQLYISQKPRFAIAGSTVANCGLYSPQMETVWFAVAKTEFFKSHDDII